MIRVVWLSVLPVMSSPLIRQGNDLVQDAVTTKYILLSGWLLDEFNSELKIRSLC